LEEHSTDMVSAEMSLPAPEFMTANEAAVRESASGAQASEGKKTEICVLREECAANAKMDKL
jgi:hypothetical protein